MQVLKWVVQSSDATQKMWKERCVAKSLINNLDMQHRKWKKVYV